jgi:signal peptidase I
VTLGPPGSKEPSTAHGTVDERTDAPPDPGAPEEQRGERPPAPPGHGFVGLPAGKGSVATAEGPATGGPGGPGEPTEQGGRHRGGKGKHGPLGFLRELPALIVIAFLLALLIKTFLVQAFYIPSVSMEPTLKVGDRVLVNKLSYKFHPPRRGDVIVFSDPNPQAQPHRNPVSAFFHWITDGLGFTAPANEDFIKRVIGLPGDTIEERSGVIFVNGHRLREPYLARPPDNRTLGPYTVRPDHLFVLGDNRGNSNDSRFPELGQIPMDKVIGKAFIIIWPPSDFGGLAGGTQLALAFA